jgi:nucleotide-binding universal stress UspA family protein
MFHQIVVPLDGSLLAEQALPIAARLARESSGALLLIRVINPPVDYSGGVSPFPMMPGETIEEEMKKAADYLDAVAARAPLTGIANMREVRYGLPAQQVLEVAEAHDSDLIVLCSHGRTGFARWALGSVAHTLIHQGTVPLLVLRQQQEPAPVETGRPFCTLVPLDGSELSEAVLAPALALTEALAAPNRGVLRLVQVVKDFRSVAEEGFVGELNKETHRLARSYLAGVAGRIEAQQPDSTLSLTTSVEVAPDVASALLDMAEQAGPQGCDLIAISTHGRGGLERWVMDSVTERLLNSTRLPMLIVRPQKKPQGKE